MAIGLALLACGPATIQQLEWSEGMYREHLRRVLDHLKRTLRIDQRLTVETRSCC